MPLDDPNDRSFFEDPLQEALKKAGGKGGTKHRFGASLAQAPAGQPTGGPSRLIGTSLPQPPAKPCGLVDIERLVGLTPEEFAKDRDGHHLIECESCRLAYHQAKGRQ